MSVYLIATILAFLSAAEGFTPPSHFVSYSTLTQSVSPQLQTIRADVAVAGKKKKPKKKKKKIGNAAPDPAVLEVLQKASAAQGVAVLEVATPTPTLEVAVPAPESQVDNELVVALETSTDEDQQQDQEKLEKKKLQLEQEKLEKEKLQLEQEKLEKEKLQLEREKLEKETLQLEQELIQREMVEQEIRRKRQEVATARSLFETRLVLEANSKLYKAKQQKEVNQRALLAERLGREERIGEVVREHEELMGNRKAAILEARQQPKAPEEEKRLQNTFAAMEDVGERAFAVLAHLGLIDISLDPTDPNYDHSNDNDFCEDLQFAT